MAIFTGCRAVLGFHDLPPDVAAADASAIGADATDGAQAEAGARFCDGIVPTPDFCADFDGENLEEGWINAQTRPDQGESGGGVIEADLATSTSQPHTAKFTVPALVGDNSKAAAFLTRTISDLDGHYTRFEFSIRIDTESFASANAWSILFSIDFDKGNIGSINLRRMIDATYLEIVRTEDGTRKARRVPLAQNLPVGQWTNVVVALKNYDVADGLGIDGGYGGGEGHVAVQVGGLQAELYVPATFRQPSGAGTWLSVGAINLGPMGTFGVHFDDVRMSLAPPL